jgi:hypothetical protein
MEASGDEDARRPIPTKDHRMSLISNQSNSAGLGYTTITYRSDNIVAGLRVLTQPFSTFVVHAFPFASIAQIVRLDAMRTAGSYLLYNRHLALAYVGESGYVANRLPKHIKDPTKQFATEVFVITSTDHSYNKEHAEFGQKYFYDAAKTAGLVTLTNEARPHTALKQCEIGPIVRELSNVFLPLFEGGCRAFHDCVQPKPMIPSVGGTEAAAAKALEPHEDDDCDEMLIGYGSTTVPLGVEEFDLKYLDFWARGYWYKDRFVVAAGSEVRVDTNKVIPGIVKKRNALEARGALAAIPGVIDRKRLLVPIMLCSDANAAEVCAGAHIDSSAWRPLARNLPLVIDL